MKRRGMSLALCAAMAMGTIGVVPAMADDVTTITYWVNDRHDSEYMTEMVEKYNKENTDNIYIDMQIITDDYENMISLAYTGGTAPDIIGQSVTLKNFVDNDMLVPLNDSIILAVSILSDLLCHINVLVKCLRNFFISALL